MGTHGHKKNKHTGQWDKAKTALRSAIKAAGVTGFAVSTATMAQELIPPYEEKGRLGDRESWQTPSSRLTGGLEPITLMRLMRRVQPGKV
jgi:hypothetical protein